MNNISSTGSGPTWVVVAAPDYARILESAGPNQALHDIELIVHDGIKDGSYPDTDTPHDEQVSDRGEVVLPSAASRLTEFVESVASHLEQSRHQGRFGRLVVVAAKEVHQPLMRTLSQDIRELLSAEVEDDLIEAHVSAIRASLPF